MPTYNSYGDVSQPGSNVHWFERMPLISFGGWAINFLGTVAETTNNDGTKTVLHGAIGTFSFNTSGQLQGNIAWITRIDGTGAELEAVGGVFDHLNIDANAFSNADRGDRYRLVFNNGSYVVNGDAGDNRLGGGSFADTLNGGDGTDTADYVNSFFSLTVDLAGIVQATGDALGDVFNSIENLRGTNSPFGDQLFGNDGANAINGLFGDDLLNGRGGNDTLHGGLGNDSLVGGAGNDTLDGGEDGIDELSYADAASSVIIFLSATGDGQVFTTGNLGTDTYISIENLRGGNFNDTLWGNNGANTVSGEGGNDKLYGAAGNDVLFGGLGDDTLYGLEGDDTIHGGGGSDTLDFTIGPMTSVTLAMDDDGNGTVTLELYGTDTFSGISNVLGTTGNDHFSGSNGANLLQGNDGHDMLLGGGGNDRVEGGDGNDTLFGDADWGFQGGSSYIGDDIVLGGRGNDRLIGSLGSDTLSGGQGIDEVTYASLADETGTGDYYIIADLANNIVRKYFIDYFDGQSYLVGTDTMNAGETDAFETFIGTAGADTLTDTATSGFFHGGAGHDTYKPMADGVNDWSHDAFGFDTIDYALATSAVTVVPYGVAAGQASGGGLGNYNFSGIDQHILTNFNDTFSSGAGSNSGVDTVFGMGGNDNIGGGIGADTLDGGAGVDTLSYKTSFGGVTVNLTTSICTGGHAQGDIISSFERLLGSDFDDRLTGDKLRNQITGGTGRDILRGGAGDDSFIYKNIGDSTFAAPGRDTITDFDADTADILDLSAIDARTGVGTANDAFRFIGTADFTRSGQVRYVELNGNTFVEINTGGSFEADMRIMLNGVLTLDDADFRL